jgi:hypothetical protein
MMGRTTLPKPWHYSKARKGYDTADSPPKVKTDNSPGEFLTGEIQGKAASAPEERLGIVLNESDEYTGYDFRRIIRAPANVAGSMEIDFWLYRVDGIEILVKVDGDWVHSLPENYKKDNEDYDTLVEYCRYHGLPKPIRIKGSDLETIEQARQTRDEQIFAL